MRIHWVFAFVLSAGAVGACSDSGSGKKAAALTVDAGSKTGTLYGRLGEQAGIKTVVADFLSRVIADPKINGYFLNSTLDTQHLSDCLVQQIGAATGGTDPYTCRTMKDAHAGLGISKSDFDDLVGHLSDALVAAHVKQADIDTILGVLGPMSADIVEDPTNDKTIYQRIGRKPAIAKVVSDFHANVAKDVVISAFFAKADLERLGTCLVSQLCNATSGPCLYGKEVVSTLDGGLLEPCHDMKTTHTGLGIAKADFDALAGDMVAALDADGVTMTDRNAIVAVLTPLCKDIVEKDPAACGQ